MLIVVGVLVICTIFYNVNASNSFSTVSPNHINTWSIHIICTYTIYFYKRPQNSKFLSTQSQMSAHILSMCLWICNHMWMYIHMWLRIFKCVCGCPHNDDCTRLTRLAATDAISTSRTRPITPSTFIVIQT